MNYALLTKQAKEVEGSAKKKSETTLKLDSLAA